MKKNLILANVLLVTGLSPLMAQEKEGTIPEVTIAAKTQQQLYKTGKNVQLLSAKDLEKFKGQTLTEILQQASGIQITGNYNNAQEPKLLKVRGGKMANVLILLDGIPLKDVTGNDYTASDLRLIAAENIESIELLNGASSVLYGSNATVSVINIKTKKNAKKNIDGQLSLRAGSFGTYAQNIILTGKKERWNFQFNGFNEKSDGFSAALGNNFEKDGFEKQNLSARASWSKDHLNIQLNGGYQHHLYEFDSGAFQDGEYRSNDQQFFGGLTAQYQYGKSRLQFNSRFTTNERLTQDWVGPRYRDLYQYKGQGLFAELYQQTTFSENVNLIAGIQYEKQNLGAKSLPWGGNAMVDALKLQDTEIENFDVFINTNLIYKNFHLDAGARLNHHSKYNNHLVYSINPYFLKEFDQLYLKVGYSYATAFIAPTLYQNYGSAPYVLPNFDLKPETNTSHEVDFSIGKKDRSLVFNASVYQRKEKDVFIYNITDYVNYSGKFQNVDQNKVKGAEMSFIYNSHSIWNLGGNYSYAERENHETTTRYPKHRIGGFLEVLPFKNNKINLGYQYVSSRNDAFYDSSSFAVKNMKIDAFHLFSINIQQQLSAKANAYINIGNLFNTNYIDVVGFTTRPRNYMLGFEYKF